MPKDKVIAYFTKYRVGKPSDTSNHQSGIPLVPTNHNERKVLVDAGDRCVAPARSRPKKRKTVKPLRLGDKGGDGSPIRPTETGTPDVAESVLWSDDVYTVRHLVKQFDGQFPVIVRVDEGHYREGAVDLARGQVLLVSNHEKQKRVLARNNSTEALISLPVDYRMDISLASSAEVVDFTTAVKERELPFMAAVSSVNPLSNTSQGNLTGEELTFLSVKDTVFLRANSIHHGWTDQSEILVIPELVQVQFSVAEGLRGGTEQEWHDYKGMFARCVRHLSFSSVVGYQGILLEGTDGNELLLASNCHLADGDSTTAESQALQAAKERNMQRIAYENLRLSLGVPRESHSRNLHLNADDYDNLPFTNKGPTATYGNVDQINGRIGRAHFDGPDVACAEGGGSDLNYNSSDLKVIRCISGTLDYRRPQEESPLSGEKLMSGSTTHGVAPDATRGFRRTSSEVSEANFEMIDQVFSEIVDLNKFDQTEVTAINDKSGALELGSVRTVEDNVHIEENPVNLDSKRAADVALSGYRMKNKSRVVGKDEDTFSTELEEHNKKVSSVGETPVPTSKVNVLGFVTKFQSRSQSQDYTRPLGCLQQRPESKSEYDQADTRSDHPQQQRPFGLEKPKPNLVQKTKPELVQNPKPVVMEKSKPAQVNRIQLPETSVNPVELIYKDRSAVANVSVAQEELPGRSDQIQPSQKPAKPLHDLKDQSRIEFSSSKPPPPRVPPSPVSKTSVVPPSPVSRTSVVPPSPVSRTSAVPPSPVSRTSAATQPVPDSKPSRLSHLQDLSNRKSKPTPPVHLVTPASSSVTREIVIKNSADVPSELESLSVAGVTQCLELLHLDKHLADFNRSAIDGRTLTDLTEKVLERQFHFTPLDASKLVRFIRGWRP